jgi:hypothetical protein
VGPNVRPMCIAQKGGAWRAHTANKTRPGQALVALAAAMAVREKKPHERESEY